MPPPGPRPRLVNFELCLGIGVALTHLTIAPPVHFPIAVARAKTLAAMIIAAARLARRNFNILGA